MFLVTGITGHVGGATAQSLLNGGHKVRGLVRNPQKAAAWADKGVELVQGDVTDSASIAAALRGVEAAFLMLPPTMAPQPGYPEARAVVDSYVDALRQVQPSRLVVLSSVGSEKTEGLGLITGTHLLEEALKDVNSPIALIRAGSFLENSLPLLGPAAQTGTMYSFIQPVDRPIASIATRDIGALAAKLLTDSAWTGRRVIELGSPYSPSDLASAMAEVLGRPVSAQAIPRDHWQQTLASFGFPAGSTWAYEEMVDGINSGWIAFGVPGTEHVAASTTPLQFFASAKDAQSQSA